eukprot:COSAG02_NODE_5893_length_3956_cov_15.470832_2_plen_564_part_00
MNQFVPAARARGAVDAPPLLARSFRERLAERSMYGSGRRQCRAVVPFDPSLQRGVGFGNGSAADQAARAARRGQLPMDAPGDAPDRADDRPAAGRQTPANRPATRRNTAIPDAGPLPMGTGTDVGQGAGRELRARAPGGQLLTPQRYKLLMRFQLWQQAVKNGLETTDSLECMSKDFNCAKTLPYVLSKRFGDRDTLTTASRPGRPEEWTEEAQAAMEAAVRSRRKGPKKRSQSGRKIRHDLATQEILNPKTQEPYGYVTVCRKRAKTGFKPRLRRKRPMLCAMLIWMRLWWAKAHKDRRWMACYDNGIARVFLDQWWAKSHAGKFAIWRCDDSDSDDDYDNVPAQPNKVMSTVGICRDAPDGKIGLWHCEKYTRRKRREYSKQPGEGRTIDGSTHKNPNAVILHDIGSKRLDKVTMDFKVFMWMMVRHVIPAIRNLVCLKSTVTSVEIQHDNCTPFKKAAPILREVVHTRRALRSSTCKPSRGTIMETGTTAMRVTISACGPTTLMQASTNESCVSYPLRHHASPSLSRARRAHRAAARAHHACAARTAPPPARITRAIHDD